MPSKVIIYIKALRAQFFTAVLIPCLLGTAIAYSDRGEFKSLYFTITLLSLLLAHGAINAFNDYYDHLNGTDENNTGRLSPFTGGSRIIQDSLLTPKEMKNFALILTALATLGGIYLTYEIGYVVFLIALLGIMAGILYSSPFMFLSSLGLGEFFVFLSFGPLTLLGSYYVQAQNFSLSALIASLPIGFLIASVLYINQFPDYDADKEAGKTNLVVRLGKKTARYGIFILMAFTYLSIILGVIYGYLPFLSLIALFGAIFGGYSAFSLLFNYNNTPKLANPIKATIVAHFLTGLLLTVSYFL